MVLDPFFEAQNFVVREIYRITLSYSSSVPNQRKNLAISSIVETTIEFFFGVGYGWGELVLFYPRISRFYSRFYSGFSPERSLSNAIALS